MRIQQTIRTCEVCSLNIISLFDKGKYRHYQLLMRLYYYLYNEMIFEEFVM